MTPEQIRDYEYPEVFGTKRRKYRDIDIGAELMDYERHTVDLPTEQPYTVVEANEKFNARRGLLIVIVFASVVVGYILGHWVIRPHWLGF